MVVSDSPSESVAAARLKFQEISSTAASRLEACAEQARAGDKKAKEADQNFTEKVQKIEKRVRERIARRIAEQEPKRGAEEIDVGGADDAEEPEDEISVEYRELISNYPIQQPAETSAQSAAPAAPPTTAARGAEPWSSRPAGGADSPPPPTDPRWSVQAGRFGRRNPQPPAPPAAPPPAPAPPKPAPRRQSGYDDDDDYENQTWLR
jgi:hypothetical protein